MGTKDGVIKVLIVEDDLPTQQLIQTYLSSISEVKIIATLNNCESLLEIVLESRPTAVFLDIELPGSDGLTTAVRLKESFPDIYVVFVTGHTKYAADAFQIEAVDYIVKPFDKERLQKAVERIKQFLAVKSSPPVNKHLLVVKNAHEIYIINPADIFFIEKESRKCKIHTTTGIYLTTELLSSLESKLTASFFRCHKSFIINTHKIEKVTPIAERIYSVTFYGSDLNVTMGRQKMEQLYSKLVIS